VEEAVTIPAAEAVADSDKAMAITGDADEDEEEGEGEEEWAVAEDVDITIAEVAEAEDVLNAVNRVTFRENVRRTHKAVAITIPTIPEIADIEAAEEDVVVGDTTMAAEAEEEGDSTATLHSKGSPKQSGFMTMPVTLCSTKWSR